MSICNLGSNAYFEYTSCYWKVDLFYLYRTDRREELWGRPMSSSGRLSAEMMMMI
jgi:hypothetical protein